MSKNYVQEPIEETRLLVLGLTGSGKSSILKALLGRSFDVTSSGIASKKMVFEPYQTLITYNNKKFILKACDTRGLNDPDVKDADTFEAIKNLYPSEFNLINRVVVCFKQDRIRAGINTTIPDLVNYLKTTGLKRENVVLALTFSDGWNEKEVNNYIAEMKEHPLLGDLFSFASEIINTALPELSTLDDDFRVVFENRRDKIIEKYYEILSKYVEPVKIMTHEKFMQEIEKHKALERESITAENKILIDKMRKENEELQEKLRQAIADNKATNENTQIITKMNGKRNKEKIKELEERRRQVDNEIKSLTQSKESSCIIL